MTLVLVPINVHKPPRIVAKLSGMSSLDTGMPYFLPHSMTAGNAAATSGVLFMKAEITAIGAIIRSCAFATERGRPNRPWAIQVMTPVSRKPATTTYSTPTVAMPSLAKPLKAWPAVMTPVNIRTLNADIITRSAETCVNRSMPKIHTNAPSVSQASNESVDIIC